MYLFIGQADVLQDAIEVELLNRKFPETIMNSLQLMTTIYAAIVGIKLPNPKTSKLGSNL